MKGSVARTSDECPSSSACEVAIPLREDFKYSFFVVGIKGQMR